MNDKHVLVIGDTILDETISSSVIGTSIETPTLKAQLQSSDIEFGGASNVVKNLLALGVNVTYIMMAGYDKYTEVYKQWDHPNLRLYCIEEDRQNLVKSRYWLKHGDSTYKHLQINRGSKEPCTEASFETILKLASVQKDIDYILMVDYSGGIYSSEARTKKLLQLLQRYKKPIIASSQLSSNTNKYPWFSGVDYMCMNSTEAAANLENYKPTDQCMSEISNILKSNVCVTLGEQGSIFIKDNKTYYALPHVVQSIDSCGAGDAFLAAFTIFCEENNIDLCNKWAALSTTQMGTKCANVERLYV